jgi:hypothetical protein
MSNMLTIVKNYSLLFELLNKRGKAVFLPSSLNDIYWFKRQSPGYNSVDYILPDGMPLVFYLKAIVKGYSER